LIYRVVVSEFLKRRFASGKIPRHIVEKFESWVEAVEIDGLETVRKVKGYHDEMLRGRLLGMRSIRLTRGWRAYYRINQNDVEFVMVERIDKHEY
jgi:plasmid maintenance system killer protein